MSPEGPVDDLSVAAPLLGFSPLQRIRRRKSTTPDLPKVRVRVRVQGFSPSSRFSPSPAFRACFVPVALMGFHPSGASPPEEVRHLVGAACALLTFLPSPPLPGERGSQALAATLPRICTRETFGRLQGFAPLESPFTVATLLVLPPAGPLMGFSLSRAFPVPCDGAARHRPSSRALRPHRLSTVARRVATRSALQSVPRAGQWPSLSRERLALLRSFASAWLAS